MKYDDEVIDEFYYVHKLAKKLGQGGQGIVYRTKDPDLAIKGVINSEGQPIKDKEEIARYYEKLKRLRYLPLPQDINISTPLALLKDQAGYVMQLLTEMIPFESFWADGKSVSDINDKDIPSWLKDMPIESAKQIVHYRNSGGLQRRLNALYKCSSILARLHGQGLVYGDISPGNVFISEDISSSQVWLIDPDNLRFYSSSIKGGVYTPKYGAPELVQGLENGSFRTDCHAFSVMAFYMLSMIHPFIGEKVDSDGSSDWADDEFDDSDIEEKAYAGFIPWVDDVYDDSNRNDGGLPRSLLLTDTLTKLFDQTFSQGREDFWKRPSIFHWTEAFAQALDKTIICSSCKMSWVYDVSSDNCPYCQSKKPNFLIFDTFLINGKEKSDISSWTFTKEIINSKQTFVLPKRLFIPFNIQSSDETFITISIEEDFIYLKKEESIDEKIYIAISNLNDGKFTEFISKINLPIKALRSTIYLFIDGKSPRIIECKYGNKI